jgi:hypothetical protein
LNICLNTLFVLEARFLPQPATPYALLFGNINERVNLDCDNSPVVALLCLFPVWIMCAVRVVGILKAGFRTLPPPALPCTIMFNFLALGSQKPLSKTKYQKANSKITN